MGGDQPLEILDRGRRDHDPRHGSESVERDTESRLRLLAPEGRSVERPWNGVEELRDIPRVRIRLVERGRQQRSSQSALVRVRPLGQLPQLEGVLGVERDVDAARR